MCTDVSCTISEITLHEIMIVVVVIVVFLDQTLPLCAPNDTVHCLFPSYGECLVILDIILRFQKAIFFFFCIDLFLQTLSRFR